MTYGRAGLAISALLFSLLTACGGGGDGASSATALPDGLLISAESTAEAGNPVSFNNSAASLGGLKFAWAFGDGTTSAEAAPQHTFAKGGDFEVRLTISNEAGASKQTSFHVGVNNRANVRGLACTGLADTGWCWQQPKPSGNGQTDIYFLDAKTAWSVGDLGEILKTSDGGNTWVKQYSGLTTPLRSVRFLDASRGWAIGEFGAVLRTIDGGASWVLQAGALAQSPYPELHVIDVSTIVIKDGEGRIRVTQDAGGTWTERSFSLAAVASDGALWSIHDGKVLKSLDLGKTSSEVFVAEPWSDIRLHLLGERDLMVSTVRSSYDDSVNRYRDVLTLHRSADSGSTWVSFAAQGLPDVSLSITQMNFADASTGLLKAGYPGSAYRTNDGGRNWTLAYATWGGGMFGGVLQVLPNNSLYRSALDINLNGSVYALSADGGLTWRHVAPPEANVTCDVRLVSASTWLCTRNGGGYYLSIDGMASWQVPIGADPQLVLRSLTSIWFLDAKRGLAINNRGELQQTTDGGLDWTLKADQLAPSGYAATGRIQFASAAKGWLLSQDGKLSRSTDAGASWATPLNGVAAISQFHFVDENNGFAVSREFTDSNGNATKPVLLASADGGQTWTKRADFVDGIYSLTFLNLERGVAVGEGGRILSTSDGGRTWLSRFSGTSNALRKVVFSGPDTAWSVGEYGVLLRSVNGGLLWSPVLQGTSASLLDVQFVDPQHGWAVGASGTILRTQDGGQTWQRQFSGTRETLNQVFFVDSRTGWVAGERGTILSTGTGGM